MKGGIDYDPKATTALEDLRALYARLEPIYHVDIKPIIEKLERETGDKDFIIRELSRASREGGGGLFMEDDASPRDEWS